MILVHDLCQAKIVKRLQPSAELLYPPSVLLTGGTGYAFACVQEFSPQPWIDSLDAAGLALGVIRLGARRLVFTGPKETGKKISDILDGLDGSMLNQPPEPNIVLPFGLWDEKGLQARLIKTEQSQQKDHNRVRDQEKHG